MKTVLRKDVIDELAVNEVSSIMSGTSPSKTIKDILINGVQGFNNLSNEDLVEEYRQTFGVEIKIFRKTLNVSLHRKDGLLIDATQIDAHDEEFAKYLFYCEFGNNKEEGDYFEWEETTED